MRKVSVTIPSTDADGFLGHGPLDKTRYVPLARSRRGKRSGKNISRGVHVSMQGQTTMRAVEQLFSMLLLDRPTTAAVVICVLRGNLDHRGTGAFSLVRKCRDEGAPRHITDRLGQPEAPQHAFGVEALHRDSPVATYEI